MAAAPHESEASPLFNNGAALLTPVGRGAIAVIGLRGPAVPAALAQRFQPRSSRGAAPRPGTPHFGLWRLGPTPAEASAREEVIVLHESEGWEIQCHGGTYVTEAILADLAAEGIPTLSPEAWLAAGGVGALEIEIRLALAECRTVRGATHLLAQLRGALESEVRAVLAAVERREVCEAVERLDVLLDRAEFGRRLVQPWRVVLAGRPNVGKSSLLNALLGFERAIVFEQPGTTRDVVGGFTAIAGLPVELLDTAGLRATEDPLEAAGIVRAEAVRAEADLVLHVLAADEPLAAELKHRRVLRVWSKCDLGEPPAGEAGLRTSALTGAGIAELLREIARHLAPVPPPTEAPLPFTARQVGHLERAAALLEGNPAAASAELRALLGGSEPRGE